MRRRTRRQLTLFSGGNPKPKRLATRIAIVKLIRSRRVRRPTFAAKGFHPRSATNI
ncbi:MAG: hypothetical protein LBP87_02360 [Planctomycetaceae bacterium]|nr:hypothetical protein [Planctomycetaceae bacterium]